MKDTVRQAPAALKPSDENDIISNWVDSNIIVSILCITYNHEKFIEQAINGFLAQKTNFAFEIIIRDDASTDTTADIIKSYAEKYPRIIKPIYESHNRFGLVDPFTVTRAAAKGRYLAYCEGDDYWIDPLKIQKQVDYFNSKPNLSLLETNTIAIEDGFIINWPGSGGTRTYMHPSAIAIPNKYNRYITFQDTYIRRILAAHGEVEKLEDVTAVWRKHEGGIFGSTSSQTDTTELNFKRAITNFWISIYYYEQSKPKDSFFYFRATINLLLEAYPYNTTTYSTRLKLAFYLVAQPVIPLLSSIKKKVKRIL